jgi:hypothetical protein
MGSGLGRARLQEGGACGVEPECLDSRELVVRALDKCQEIVVHKAPIL